MDNITNSDVIKHVLNGIFKTTSRRTSKDFSIVIIRDIIQTLQEKFDFLKGVKLRAYRYSEEDNNIVNIWFDIDTVDSAEIAKAIESIIRVISMNMKNEKAGLYVITELKKHVEDRYVSWLKKNGVDLDLIQLEQHHLYKQEKKKKLLPRSFQGFKSNEKDRSSYVSLLNYTWDNVGFWEFKDNICIIYDKKGDVLDRMPLDKIIKDYVMEMTGFDELPLKTDKIVEIDEREYEFLQVLYQRDIDAETAMQLLNISKDELNVIIRKLLVYEVLQYISLNEVMLTENAITLLINKSRKK